MSGGAGGLCAVLGATKEGEGQLRSSGAWTTAVGVVRMSFVTAEEERLVRAVAEACTLTEDKPNAKLCKVLGFDEQLQEERTHCEMSRRLA